MGTQSNSVTMGKLQLVLCIGAVINLLLLIPAIHRATGGRLFAQNALEICILYLLPYLIISPAVISTKSVGDRKVVLVALVLSILITSFFNVMNLMHPDPFAFLVIPFVQLGAFIVFITLGLIFKLFRVRNS